MFGIRGLLYIPDYITEVEEKQSTKTIDKQDWDSSECNTMDIVMITRHVM